MADKGRTIRVPVHMGDKMRKMACAYNEVSADSSGFPPTRRSPAPGWTVEQLRDVKSAIPYATSLHQPLSSEALPSLEPDRGRARLRHAGMVMREMETDAEGGHRAPSRSAIGTCW